ncbi:MAG: 2-phospho-L-lactate guanylyltransferase [Proteobacteria bacterium]|nr:2-phospho-L-lactate guanylyltransferase [Pseudomonadota bacterium]HQR03574.1 2-phospho-L-lactate guanylyltransferase [Rhodocyclaceae bacterium]
MSCWALVPLKARHQGKSRLAGVLGPGLRQQLIGLMVEDVVAALAATRSIDHIAVVSPEAIGLSVVHLPDRAAGLNGVIEAAAFELAGRGASELVVLPADLPLVSAADIDALVAAGRERDMALAPDRHQRGTNAIHMAPTAGFTFHFGLFSFERHLAEAAQRDCAAAVVRRPGLGFDVDEPADLEQLLAQGGPRYAFLADALRSPTWPLMQHA